MYIYLIYLFDILHGYDPDGKGAGGSREGKGE
jgi:hypothetical protein